MANDQDISKVIARLSAAFPNWNVNAFTMQVYYEDLQDIPADELEMAARQCRMEPGRAFAPSIGELRKAWNEIHEKLYPPKPLLPPVIERPLETVPMPDWVRDQIKKVLKSKENKIGRAHV